MSTAPTTRAAGRCLCGAVRYEIAGALRPVVCCHCEQCRRSSGHFAAASACRPGDLKLTGDASVSWYRSSPRAERGFCAICGSSLFWRPDHGRYVSVMAGTLDRPTRLQTACHIYVDSASDYYAIADGRPQHGEDYPDALGVDLE